MPDGRLRSVRDRALSTPHRAAEARRDWSPLYGRAYRLVTLSADWTSEGARLALERWLKNMSKDTEVPGVFVGIMTRWRWGCRQPRAMPRVRSEPPLDQDSIVGCDGTPTLGRAWCAKAGARTVGPRQPRDPR